MIDLHLAFGETTTASLLFDGATAVRMKPQETSLPFEPDLSLAKLIEIFSQLQARCVDFIGSAADQVTVYRPVGLAPGLVEWLHASSFAAGFARLNLVGLADIMPAILPNPRGKLLVVNASRQRIEAAALVIGPNDSASHVLELSVPVDVAACENAVVAQLERSAIETSSFAPLARKLVDLYWKSADPDWSLHDREWQSGGWSVVTLNRQDAALDAIAGKAIAVLLDKMPAAFGDAQMAIVGEAAPRMEVFASGLSPELTLMHPPSTEIIDAMVAYSRSRFNASTAGIASTDRASEKPLARIELVLDARTELDSNGIEVRRDYSGVYVKIEVGKRLRLSHVPAKWHRNGLTFEVTRGERTERVHLFHRQPGLSTATFSIHATASQTSPEILLISVTLPEFKVAALVIASAETDLIVEHFQV
jgi:hypothetical protein